MTYAHRLFLFGLTCLVVIGLTSHVIISHSYQDQKEYQINANDFYVNNVHKEVNNLLKNYLTLWTAYGQGELVQNELISSIARQEKLVDRQNHFESMDQEWRANSKIGQNLVQEILSSPLSKDLKRIELSFNRLMSSYVFGEVFLTNRYG